MLNKSLINGITLEERATGFIIRGNNLGTTEETSIFIPYDLISSINEFINRVHEDGLYEIRQVLKDKYNEPT